VAAYVSVLIGYDGLGLRGTLGLLLALGLPMLPEKLGDRDVLTEVAKLGEALSVIGCEYEGLFDVGTFE